MQILNGGQTIAIGDVELAGSAFSLNIHQWVLLLVLLSGAVPLAIAALIDPAILNEPFAAIQIAFFSLLLMSVALTAKYFIRLIAHSGGTISVIFDRVARELDVVFDGFFGTTRRSINFDDIRAIRISRGEWSGSSVSEIAVVDLATGETIVLPEALSALELNMLRVLTGLRRT